MIHLIIGNTGSGKTTYAQRLKENKKAVIFSIDQWNNTLFIPDKLPENGIEWFLQRIERAEKMICSLITQLEEADVDSILDLGLSKFDHRQKFRDFAIENNYEIKHHYLNIPKAVRWERVKQRNTQKGATFEFEVSEENFNFMETWFEIPKAKELENGVVINL